MNKPDRPSLPEDLSYPFSYDGNYPGYPGESRLNISKYRDILQDGWWLIAASLLGFLILAGLYIFVTPKQYTATATIQVEEQDQSKLELNNQSWQDAQSSLEKLNTVVDKLQSAPLRAWVLSEAGLIPSNLLSSIGAFSNTNNGLVTSVVAPLSGRDSSTIPKASMLEGVKLVSAMEKQMTAKLRRNTRLIDLTVTCADPNRAAQLANLMVAGYLEQDFKIRSTTDRSQSELFQLAKQRLADKLKASEQALQNYREQVGTVELSASDNGAASQLVDIATYRHQLSDMKAQVIQFKAAYEGSLAMGTNSDGLLAYAQISSDPQVQLLQTAIAQKQADLVQLKQLYREKNPKYVVAVNTLNELKQQLQEVVLAIRSRIQESLRLPYVKAQAEVSDLEKELAQAEQKSLELSRKSIQYNLLAREVASDQALFNSVLEKLKVTAANSQVAPVNISMVSAAMPPTASSTPKVRLSFMAAVILGLGFGLFVVLLRAGLKNNLGSVEEAELFFSVPVLGFQNQLKLESDNHKKVLFNLKDPHAAEVENFRSIIANISIKSKSAFPDTPQVVLFSSTFPGEGKTFMTANYASGLARQGFRTVALDLDLHKPSLDGYFSKVQTGYITGISNLLLNECTLSEAIQPHPIIQNLSWIPSGPLLPAVSEHLAGDRLQQIIAELLKKFDRVVIDTPPLGLIKDSLYLTKFTQIVIIVTDARRTNRHKSLETIKAFENSQVQLTGVVLNYVPRRKRLAKYYDHYYQQRPS